MSSDGLQVALKDRRFSGVFRLAYLAIGDNGGMASVESVARWCGCDREAASAIISEMLDAAVLEHRPTPLGWVTVCPIIKRELERLSAPASNEDEPKWTISRAKRNAIYNRDGRKCHYCGSTGDLTLDHKKPRSSGGGDEMDNLVTSCRSCNSAKGARPYDEFVAGLAGVAG